MCHLCNYSTLLEASGLGTTPNRLKVLEIIGNNNSPLSAQEIHHTLKRTQAVNRVTVYRVLDLLVTNGLIDRIIGGGRSFHYGLAANENHEPHPHFYCRECGNMECLNPESMHVDMEPIRRTFPGRVEGMQVRLEGVCKNCLRKDKRTLN